MYISQKKCVSKRLSAIAQKHTTIFLTAGFLWFRSALLMAGCRVGSSPSSSGAAALMFTVGTRGGLKSKLGQQHAWISLLPPALIGLGASYWRKAAQDRASDAASFTTGASCQQRSSGAPPPPVYVEPQVQSQQPMSTHAGFKYTMFRF